MKNFSLLILALLYLSGFSQIRKETNQYMAFQPVINFSAATSYYEPAGSLFYRNQWVGFSGAPENYGLQVAVPLTEKKSVLGVGFLRDKIGINTSDEIKLDYGYRLKLNQTTHLGFSVSAKTKFVKQAYSELLINDVQDPLTSADVQVSFLPNASFGSYLFTNNYYVGVSIADLLHNTINGTTSATSFELNKWNPQIHAGYEIPIKTSSALGISTLIKTDFGASTHADLNLMYFLKDKFIGVGVSIRSTKDIVPMLSIAPVKEWRIGYAYQYNFGGLTNYQSGTHEILIIYQRKSGKDLVKLYAPRF